MAIKLPLKDRLIHLFRQPVLLLSANCGGRRSSPGRKEKKSSKKEIRVRENGKLYMTGDKADQEGRTCPPTSPSSPSSKINHDHYYYFKEEQKNGATKQKKKKKKKKKKDMMMMMMAPRSKRCELFSSSAMESADDLGFFSSHEEREEEEEANKEEDIETFFSSRSFSSDSSDFYKKAKKIKRRPLRRRREKKSRCIWVTDGFQPLVSISRRKEEEKKEASFAVTKKSSDPYGDFQSSMVEMIVERQIFGAGELQLLLHSYLSLNSVQNHPVILRAFVDISQVLFGY
ncbi:hypothetical protein IEQ34_017887 [Dendrobium chrysotoxum]|uniref:Transcription repressor n=1 Tax=Dendrobium chrysotoxum TaxID=161865 RepID=A0AAV7GCT3_DENCH|nr:hypothetical protein IEQ34_017887 [Dendrobium chrysotoxum]